MKKKIYNICGVALALVLVFSLFGAFVPARQVEAQGTTPNTWQAINLPSAGIFKIAAADVGDFAVASDGKTIYAVDTQGNNILVSPNNGGRWSVLLNAAGMAALGMTAPARLIAVSPDDPNAIAIVDSSNGAGAVADGTVWISNNGGTTWAALNPVSGANAAAGTSMVTDIAVGPARAGTILGREYVVTTADITGGAVLGGDVLYQGLTTAWTSCVTATGIINYDFTSVAISPGFLGDRAIVAVGSDIVAGDTFVLIFRTSDVAPLATLLTPPGAVALNTATTNSPGDFDPTGVGGRIIASDVALPSDFDPTIPSGMRTFVGYTSGAPAADFNDVYRIDFQTVRKLQTGAANGIFSIAYNGTISGGTLIAGEATVTAVFYTLVHYTTDPQLSQPSWTTSAKSPTGVTNCVVGIDPADPTLVYAGTTGAESAFSVSTNGAVSFNQRSLINTERTVIQDIMLTPDGSTIFMATVDAGAGAGTGAGSASDRESLWKSPVPTSGSSWERIRLSPADWGDAIGDSIIRLSPEWDDVPALYWCDRFTVLPDVGTGIQRSADGGDVFSTRTAPAAIADATVETADILYMTNGGNVFQSTNGAWFFGLPVATGIPGAIYDIAMLPTYPEKPIAGNLIIGGTVAGGVMISSNSGASWRPLTTFIAGGRNMQVIGDVDYANNNTVYAADAAPGSGIWRYVIGTSTVWENIGSPAGLATAMPATATMTGLAMQGKALYSSWTAAVAAAPGVVADAFTITGAAAIDAGNVTVLAGSLLATSTSAGVTLGGVAAPFSFPILPGAGAVAFTFPAAGGVITFTATTANSTGTWAITGGAPVAAITANLDGDEAIAPAGGNWVLTDTAVAAGVGAAASGAERSLVPTLPVIANWIFESMDVGAVAANFNTTPNALRIAGNATGVSLWAINTAANTVMAYDDTMAKTSPDLTVPSEVPIDPVSGRNAEFNITWKAMSNATTFQAEIYTDAKCTQRVLTTGAAYIPPNPLSPAWVVLANQLVAGTDYYVRARARNQTPGDAIRSGWSKVAKLTIAGGERVEVSYLGVQPLGPEPGATDVPLSPGFTWAPYAGSTKYEFQLATDAGFSDILAEAKVAATGYKYDGKLDYATTYFWRARGIEPTATDWSPVASFTTEKAPPPPPAPPPPTPEPPPPVVTPAIIWTIIGIGAILVIAVIILIVRTRRIA